MSATLAPSARPINALHMWTDGKYIYAEVPSQVQPCIFKLPLNEGGLWKALNLLRKQTYEYGGESMIIAKPIDHREALGQSILKKMGLL